MAKKPAKKSAKPQSTLSNPRRAVAQAAEVVVEAAAEAAEVVQEHVIEPVQERVIEPAAEAVQERVVEPVAEAVKKVVAPPAPKPKKARYLRPKKEPEKPAAAALPMRSTTAGGKMMSKDVKAGPKDPPAAGRKPKTPHGRP